MATRYFSLDEANALIPQIRVQLGIALQLHKSLRRLVEDINDAGYDVDWATLHGEVDLDDEAEPKDLRNLEKARGLYAMLRDAVDTIEDAGPEVKGVVDGLVDFPTWKDGALTSAVLIVSNAPEGNPGLIADGNARVLAALLNAPELPPVLNVAAPGAIEMGALLDAAGCEYRLRPAPQEAIARVELDVSLLTALLPEGLLGAADAAAMVREWSSFEPGLF